MLSNKPWEGEDNGDAAMPTPLTLAHADTFPVPALLVPQPPAPDTLAHKAERLSDQALDAAIASALSGDHDAAALRLTRVQPPCVLHPGRPKPKTHRNGARYTPRGAGLQAKKVSPWRR